MQSVVECTNTPVAAPLIAPYRRVALQELGVGAALVACAFAESFGRTIPLAGLAVGVPFGLVVGKRNVERVNVAVLSEPPSGSVFETPMRTALRAIVAFLGLIALEVTGIFLPITIGAAAGIAGVVLGVIFWRLRDVRRLARVEKREGWRLLCELPQRWVVFGRHSRLSIFRSAAAHSAPHLPPMR